MKKPVLLLIRDGWGINPAGRSGAEREGDATLLASTPVHDRLYKKYPMSRLQASGLEVGLPEGQMGGEGTIRNEKGGSFEKDFAGAASAF